MSIIVCIKDTFYADRKITHNTHTPLHFTYDNKLIVNEGKTWAFMQIGVLPSRCNVDKTMELCLAFIATQNEKEQEAIRKQLLKQIRINQANNFLFAVKGKAYVVKLISAALVQEFNENDMFISGSAQNEFLTDYKLGYPIAMIFDRISKSIDTVGKEFDSINFHTDLNPIAVPLSSI